MGEMKRIWGALSERERRALGILNEVARTASRPWLRDLANRKARELEQIAFERERPDVDLAREVRNPYKSGFGRHPT